MLRGATMLRVGRLRELEAAVSFVHLSLQEFFAAHALLHNPRELARKPSWDGLDLPQQPAVCAFVRDLLVHRSPEGFNALH